MNQQTKNNWKQHTVKLAKYSNIILTKPLMDTQFCVTWEDCYSQRIDHMIDQTIYQIVSHWPYPSLTKAHIDENSE